MAYVDGFVIPIPKKNMAAYKRMAATAAKVWKSYGALDYKECVGDDLKVKWGLPFTKLAKTKSSETVVFSYILYRSKAHRDAVNKKMDAVVEGLKEEPDKETMTKITQVMAGAGLCLSKLK